MAEDWTRDQGQRPPPVSGERVQGIPTARSRFSKTAEQPGHGSDTRGQVIKAGLGRAGWEASDIGQARTRNIEHAMHETHGVTASAGQIYDDYRRAGHIGRQQGPTAYDVQLPGMADPHAAPRPPKWEELSPETQSHLHVALAKHGTSIGQMTEDFGAQHDQATMRALGHGHDTPYAQTFYSTGEPRQVIRSSAREMGIPELIHAQMNAFTSPNTKFTHSLKSGETTYPNDMAAKHAVLHAKSGGDPAELREMGSAREMRRTGLVGPEDTRRVQGYPANLEKAAQAIHQHLAGVAPADWRTGQGAGAMGNALKVKGGVEVPIGHSPWESSPKTGPYANSWSDTHPQYFVSDVHSGGGGGLPHLSSFKGREGGDSERELGIKGIPHFHVAMDYAARQAMTQRGLPSVRETQAAQWGEEQLQRREEAETKGWSTSHYPTVSEAYPEAKSRRITQRGSSGQESLF